MPTPAGVTIVSRRPTRPKPGRHERILAVGDVHGQRVALDAVLDAASPRPGDLVVLLGDYVNGGPDSAGVLERVGELTAAGAVALLGNHDWAMREALRAGEGPALRPWAERGARRTLASYGAHPAASIRFGLSVVPEGHRAVLESLRLTLETERFIFVHGGLDPRRTVRSQPASVALWQKLDRARPHPSGKTVVCGHTRQREGRVVNLGHTLCLDTNAKEGGWLTCVELSDTAPVAPAEGGWIGWQASVEGAVRPIRVGRAAEPEPETQDAAVA